MSFGSGFGGFGSNNNNNNNNTQQQNTSTGFGFGSSNNNSNNNTGGFGSSSNTGFGSTNNNQSGGSIFGGGNTSNTGFGSGGFGSNNQTSGFGARPAFGAATTSTGGGGGGGLFGSSNNNAMNSNSSGFGGFGGTTQNNTSTGFGSTTTGGGLFGQQNNQNNQNTTGFGSSTSGSGGLFGNSGGNTSGFGNTGGGFGSSNSGFGSNTQAQLPQNNGTGQTPFQPFTEKDGANSASEVRYQSIVCQQPYTNFSFEELRTADYSQGRKYGNQSGQAGAFGASTGFGSGFGSNQNQNTTGFGGTSTASGGLFGQSTNNATGFGAQSQTTGFGASNNATTGGLFGQQQGARAGGMFGATSNTTSTQSGGLFGSTATATSTGFGQTAGGFGSSNNTSSGLFGQQANNQAPKSVFGGATGGSGFGSGGFGQNTNTNTTGGGLFGSSNQQNQGGFGANQPANQSASVFGGGSGTGAFGQQNQNQNQGGGLFAGGGFGNTQQNQQKSLFGGGTQNTGTGLFGQANNQQQGQSGGLFGGANNQQQQSGGLFGGSSNQPKPGGLFGATTNTGTGGLFGTQNNQNQQNQSGGLFGQNTNQPKPPTSLFGGGGFGGGLNNNTNTGGGLFGGSINQQNNAANNQQQGTGLFGGLNQNQNQNQQSQMGQSLFGSTMQSQQQQPQQPQQLMASIQSNSPYGNEHLFAGLGTPQPAVGPLATPLSSTQKARRPAPMPQYNVNPAASTRLLTPMRGNGYGFSYSTYGTPGSATSSPIYGNTLLGNGLFGRSLSKSLSTSNLRTSYNQTDSILNPNAFSPGALRPANGSKSLKKLKINRNLRTDLFGSTSDSETVRTNSPLKKTVSFDSDAIAHSSGQDRSETNGSNSTALVRVGEDESPTPTPEDQQTHRGARANEKTTEIEQVRGNELAIVPEDGPAPSTTSSTADYRNQTDQVLGDYWMSPSVSSIRKMSRQERSNVTNLTVGRDGAGKVEFGPVDLNTVDVDKIQGSIVRLSTRIASVYPSNDEKPPAGKGLNVPSTITLENSWPRAKAGNLPVHERKGSRFEKHIQRLKRVDNTEFVHYDVDTGEWTFRVDHFSSYQLDYDDDDESMLSPPPDTPSPKSARSGVSLSGRKESSREEESFWSNSFTHPSSNIDDTFEFRRSRALPGAFDEAALFDQDLDTHEILEDDSLIHGQPSQVADDDDDLVVTGTNDSSIFDDNPAATNVATGSQKSRPTNGNTSFQPKSILKVSLRHGSGMDTPSRAGASGGDWADQLQRTISPKKRDREALRQSQSAVLHDLEDSRKRVQSPTVGKEKAPFTTSVDVMNSLFGKSVDKRGSQGNKRGGFSKAFEWPYPKRLGLDEQDLGEVEQDFHDSFKPNWTADGLFVYPQAGDKSSVRSDITRAKQPIISQSRDVCFAQFPSPSDTSYIPTMNKLIEITAIGIQNGIPYAITSSDFRYADFATLIVGTEPARSEERNMWQLASILFDDKNKPRMQLQANDISLKQDLMEYWKALVQDSASKQLISAPSNEEKAFVHLSSFNVWDAVSTLAKGADYRLSTMIAQIGSDNLMKDDMKQQVDAWRDLNILSEIPNEVRVLYELLAGNTCVSQGKSGPGSENRAETFNISHEFNLDWRRAFGLRLWYGIELEEPVTEALKMFQEDLDNVDDEPRPLPWFVTQNANGNLDSEQFDGQEDILWGLLQTFAYAHMNPTPEQLKDKIGDIVSNRNVTGNMTDNRLPFQLYHMLGNRDIVDFNIQSADDKGDQLTSSFLFQLSSKPDQLCNAVFVALHFSFPAYRAEVIQDLLNHHASTIGDSKDTSPVYKTLVEHLQIPEPWIWSAKAVHAKAVLGDRPMEVRCLLRAGESLAAHETFKRVVAPAAVIEQDPARLKTLLNAFEDIHAPSGAANEVEGWEHGGGVYADYVALVELCAAHGRDTEKRRLANRLVDALPAMQNPTDSPLGLEERVAIYEIEAFVVEVVEALEKKGLKGKKMGKTAAEKEDGGLKQAMELSQAYYATALA